MSARVRGELRGVENTMLMTLYVRAVDAGSRHPVLGDPTARDVLARIDHDPWRVRLFRGNLPVLVTRAKVLDDRVQAHLDAHPDTVVAHLACGLDSRSTRLRLPAGVTWYDLDRPEVIDLRRRLYPEQEGVHTVAASATDPTWWAGLPDDGPLLVVAEGLFMYLDRDDLVATLTPPLTRSGSTVLMADTVAAWVRLATTGPVVSTALGAPFRSTTADVDRVIAAVPRPGRAPVRLVDDVPLAEAARRAARGLDRWTTGAVSRVPGVGGSMRVRVWEAPARQP